MTEKDQKGCKVYKGVWSRKLLRRNIQGMKCIICMAENTRLIMIENSRESYQEEVLNG